MNSATPYDPSTARPARLRGPIGLVFRWIAIALLTVFGWKREGDWPGHDKAVIIAAPHTSNWDGLVMLVAAAAWRIKLRWMGKASLVKGPTGPIVRWLGCVPVERTGGKDIVRQTADAFSAADQLVLAVSPEGTRSRTEGWKSGFYHIAHGAGVPIIFSVLDFGTKTIRLAGEIMPSGDYEADLKEILPYYDGARGLRDGKFNLED